MNRSTWECNNCITGTRNHGYAKTRDQYFHRENFTISLAMRK